MARLPDASALGERPSPQPAMGVASIQPATNRLGQAVSEAGRQIEQAANIVEETNRRQDTIVAEAALNSLQQQRVTLEFDPKVGFRQQKEGKAVGQQFIDGYMSKFDDAASAITEGLANDQQRAFFTQRIPVVGLHYRSALLEHQAVETGHFNDSTEKSSLELLVQSSAMQPTNDIALQTGLVRGYSIIDSVGQRKGLPAETVTEMKAKFVDANYAARVQANLIGVPGVVEANPYVALAMIQRDREKMLPATALKLTHEANTAIRMQENARRIDDDRRLKDAEKAIEDLGMFALSGQNPDEGYQALVRSKTQGTPFEAHAEQLLAQSKAGAMHGSKSIPQQEEGIRKAEAAAAQGTSPEAQKVLERARKITDTQIADYKENPWAASARFQRLPSVPDKPLPSADAVPGYVQQVLPLMTGVETAAGPQIQVSPLQPAQAQAFTQQLQALPAAQRAEVLGQTGGQLSATQIQALADQIDKGHRPTALALKLGADRTNAGRMVSELVLRGADAIKDKAVKRDDSTLTGWRSEISRLVRGTLGDAQAEQDVIDAAYYVRVATDHEGSSAPGYNLTASNENAVKLVIGAPIERGGVKTILPRGMDENTFTEKLRAFTPARLAIDAPAHAVWVRGQTRTLQQLWSALPGMGLTRDGQGNYIPVSGGALVTIDAAGQVPLRLRVQ